jgi:hypothetical protein
MGSGEGAACTGLGEGGSEQVGEKPHLPKSRRERTPTGSVANGYVWAKLSLNPAISVAIAGTGWRREFSDERIIRGWSLRRAERAPPPRLCGMLVLVLEL